MNFMTARPKPKHADQLLLEQVNQLYAQSHLASMGSGIAAVLTGFFLWPSVGHGRLSAWWVTWVIAAVCGTVFRQFFILRYRQSNITPVNVLKWKNLFIGLVFLSGGIWGSAAFVIFPEASLTHQVFLAMILSGMVAGAMGPFSVVLTAFLAYAVPTLMPIIIFFFFAGTSVHLAMGAAILFYLGFMCVIGYHFFNRTRAVLMLKFENIDLIHHLEAEKLRTDAINNHLKDEVSERKRIEEILKRHRENLEGMVDERTSALQKSNIDLKKEIIERGKAQQALKESEEKYRLLVENASDAIFIYQDGVSKFHNQRTESLLGFSAGELKEIPFVELCRITDPHFFNDRLKGSPENRDLKNTPAGSPIKLLNSAQKTLWVRISTVPVLWDNTPALLCFIRDITQQQLLENQLLQAQKIEAIGTMAAGIAHDFNNILSGIQGNTSLALMAMAPSHEHYKKLRDIESYVTSGTDLTRQLMDFASAKNNRPEPMDIIEHLRETVDMFSRTRKEVRLKACYLDTHPVIEADSGQIRQAMMNLLINAWQAMPDGGGIEILTEITPAKEMDAVPFTSAENYIRISIADSGVGMSPELVAKIFDPFFTTKKRGKGTGLGLSSVYGIIQRHGGHIRVDSQLGKGSTFHVYLPLSVKTAPLMFKDEAAILPGTETILVIDDEPDILEIAKEMLEALGYAVHTAPGGSEAIELYARQKDRIDLVILDMVMPEMNGEAVYRHLSAMNPDVKVLIASGYSPSGPAEKIIARESCDFIQKPFKIQHLSQTIRKILA